MPIVSSSMPEQLRDDLDQYAETHRYEGRSEVIREACTLLLDEFDGPLLDEQRVVTTVTALFGYDEPSIERKIMDVRHEFDEIIRSTSHDCLGEREGCTQTFVLLSSYATASSLISTLRGISPEVSVEYSFSEVNSDP